MNDDLSQRHVKEKSGGEDSTAQQPGGSINEQRRQQQGQAGHGAVSGGGVGAVENPGQSDEELDDGTGARDGGKTEASTTEIEEGGNAGGAGFTHKRSGAERDTPENIAGTGITGAGEEKTANEPRQGAGQGSSQGERHQPDPKTFPEKSGEQH